VRANVYVDGFNLYYGALKGTPLKWLDIAALCRLLLPGDTINRIRYFTARIQPTRAILTRARDSSCICGR